MKRKIIIFIIVFSLLVCTVQAIINDDGTEVIIEKGKSTIIFGNVQKPVVEYNDGALQLQYIINDKTFSECEIKPMIITQTQIDAMSIIVPIRAVELKELSIEEVQKVDFKTVILKEADNQFLYEHLMDPKEVTDFYYQLPKNSYFDGKNLYCGKFTIDFSDAINKQGFKINYDKEQNRIQLIGDYSLIDPDINFSSSSTVCGVYNYDNIVINNSAVLTVCQWNSTTNTNGSAIFNATSIIIYGNSIINGTGFGYLGGTNNGAHNDGYGPGNGTANSGGGGGGAYGGTGGNGCSGGSCGTPVGIGGVSYGSLTNVSDMGSGGGGANGGRGADGGAYILLNATSIINITDSKLLFSGGSENTIAGNTSGGGGGAGGGINIQAINAYFLNVTLNASGSNGYTSSTARNPGGGAGGRILITSCNNNSTGINYYVLGGLGNKTLAAAYQGGTNGTDGTFLMVASTDCPASITAAALLTPLNGTYWTSTPNITGTCTGSGNITASLYLNSVYNVNNSNVTSGITFSLPAALAATTEYTAYINCSANQSSMLSNNLTFFNVGTIPVCTGNASNSSIKTCKFNSANDISLGNINSCT